MPTSRPPVLVTIREATPADAEVLVVLVALGAVVPPPPDPSGAVPTDDPEHCRQALEEIAATPTNTVLVAEVGGQVVGMCQLLVFRHVHRGGQRCAELESVHVHPEHRSAGVGGQLVEAAVARARQAGCGRVQLTSNAARTDAHRFYRRHGFEPSHVGFKRTLED